MKWVLGYIGALCVLVLIISQSIIIPTFFMPFFNWHYTRTDKAGITVAQDIGISHDDLMYVTTELLSYMRGNRDSLDGVNVTVLGNRGRGVRTLGENFFSPTEIRHMVDVKDLYTLLYKSRGVAFFLLIAVILAMKLIYTSPVYMLLRCSREVLVGFLGIGLIVGVLCAVNFEYAWDIFHHIFFRGDSAKFWLLIPYSDLMINLFPLHFFIYISVFFAVLVIAFSMVILVGGSVYLHFNKDKISRLL